ncbi:hypothetical protein [Rhizobium sp. G21]|uniref:hypothetical protein n=1 Tax=Rhizobium sp. G21 TaxID=2758439 RepID=UPI0016006B69|nr:hypothetical protein [Rhizobium sp. G21]MBB1251653.1 hypothetical protein [Rhizobium sp. G21]
MNKRGITPKPVFIVALDLLFQRYLSRSHILIGSAERNRAVPIAAIEYGLPYEIHKRVARRYELGGSFISESGGHQGLVAVRDIVS